MRNLRTELKYALAFFTMTLIWMCIERITGLHSTHIDKHATYSMLYAIPAIVIYILALREKRDKDFTGIITYRQAFKSGIILTLFITISAPIGQYITSTYITPHYFENAINYSVSTNMMTMDVAVKEFSLNNYLMMSVIGAACMGIVTTAIVAIFVKKNK